MGEEDDLLCFLRGEIPAVLHTRHLVMTLVHSHFSAHQTVLITPDSNAAETLESNVKCFLEMCAWETWHPVIYIIAQIPMLFVLQICPWS